MLGKPVHRKPWEIWACAVLWLYGTAHLTYYFGVVLASRSEVATQSLVLSMAGAVVIVATAAYGTVVLVNRRRNHRP